MNHKKVILMSLLAAVGFSLNVHANIDKDQTKPSLNDIEKTALLAPYPKAISNLTRHVFFLEPKEDENNYRVEIILGKTIAADCNLQSFSGNVKEEDVKGWGYSYYKLDKVYGPATTLMACPNNTKTDKFVQVHYKNALKRYNSKLPVVIYTPKDIEVKYRVWQAGPETAITEKIATKTK